MSENPEGSGGGSSQAFRTPRFRVPPVRGTSSQQRASDEVPGGENPFRTPVGDLLPVRESDEEPSEEAKEEELAWDYVEDSMYYYMTKASDEEITRLSMEKFEEAMELRAFRHVCVKVLGIPMREFDNGTHPFVKMCVMNGHRRVEQFYSMPAADYLAMDYDVPAELYHMINSYGAWFYAGEGHDETQSNRTQRIPL